MHTVESTLPSRVMWRRRVGGLSLCHVAAVWMLVGIWLIDPNAPFAALVGAFMPFLFFPLAGTLRRGLTFPQDVWFEQVRVPGPFVRFDYVFHSHDLCAEHARVICEGAADHCYVQAKLYGEYVLGRVPDVERYSRDLSR
ncbi:MAG: hypothetical protein JXB35_03000 [Anaerolineae bacterium]|nr:hypothetical protein [Anaerolineae bacterium]